MTGAIAGIGPTAQAFRGRGAQVALVARGAEGLAAAARDVERAGGATLQIPTNVANHAQVQAAAERVEAELGPIDVWVNVAFTSVFAPFTEIEPEEFRRVTDLRWPPTPFCTRPTTPGTVSTGWGGSTVATLAANPVAPGLLDRYLARTGVSSQQTDQPHDPHQPANL